MASVKSTPPPRPPLCLTRRWRNQAAWFSNSIGNSLESDINSLESDINSPESDVNAPKSDVNSPESDVNSPESDVNSPESDVNSPESDAQTVPLSWPSLVPFPPNVLEINHRMGKGNFWLSYLVLLFL